MTAMNTSGYKVLSSPRAGERAGRGCVRLLRNPHRQGSGDHCGDGPQLECQVFHEHGTTTWTEE